MFASIMSGFTSIFEFISDIWVNFLDSDLQPFIIFIIAMMTFYLIMSRLILPLFNAPASDGAINKLSDIGKKDREK